MYTYIRIHIYKQTHAHEQANKLSCVLAAVHAESRRRLIARKASFSHSPARLTVSFTPFSLLCAPRRNRKTTRTPRPPDEMRLVEKPRFTSTTQHNVSNNRNPEKNKLLILSFFPLPLYKNIKRTGFMK